MGRASPFPAESRGSWCSYRREPLTHFRPWTRLGRVRTVPSAPAPCSWRWPTPVPQWPWRSGHAGAGWTRARSSPAPRPCSSTRSPSRALRDSPRRVGADDDAAAAGECRDPGAVRRPGPGLCRRGLGDRRRGRGRAAQLGGVRRGVLRVRARASPTSQGWPGSWPCPGWTHPARGCRPARWPWPEPGAASTPRRPRAAGGSWGPPTPCCGTRSVPSRRCSRPAPGSGSSRHERRDHVLEAGTLTTVQDRGRAGFAHLGVPRAGALDAPAAALANRLVGNDPDAALLEVTAGGPGGAPRGRTLGRGDRCAGRRSWSTTALPGTTVPSGCPPGPRPAGNARGRACGPTSPSRAASQWSRCSAPGPPTPWRASARRWSPSGQVLPVGRPGDAPRAARHAPATTDRAAAGHPGPARGLVRRRRRRGAVRRDVRRLLGLEPHRSPAGRAAADARAHRRAAQRGHGARGGPGAAERDSGGVPRRPPAHRGLPGGRRRGPRRPVAVRPAAPR